MRIFVNILGLIPYVFSSSHFVFSVSIRFPVWLSLILLGWVKFNRSSTQTSFGNIATRVDVAQVHALLNNPHPVNGCGSRRDV